MRLPVVRFDGDSCTDPGVDAVFRLGDRTFLLWVVWMGVAVSVERLVAALQLFCATRVRAAEWRSMRVFPRYVAPQGLALLWACFTSLSIVFVATAARGRLAVLFKMLHVATEAAFLVLILRAHRLHLAAALVVGATASVAGMVVASPCADTISVASFAGLVVDSSNFASHLIVGVRQCDNAPLWVLIAAFGWHALYLSTYLIVQRWTVPREYDAVLAGARIAGMLFNLVAIAFVVEGARRDLLPPAGTLEEVTTLREWRAARVGLPRALWLSDRRVALEDAGGGGGGSDDDDPEGALVPLHEPHLTGYVVGTPAPAPARRPGGAPAARQGAPTWVERLGAAAAHAARRTGRGAAVRAYACCLPCDAALDDDGADEASRPLAPTTEVRTRSYLATDAWRVAVAVVVGTVLWAY